MKHYYLIPLTLGIIAVPAFGATINISASTPVVDGADIANMTWNSTRTLKSFSDAPNWGQSFTTDSDPLGYTLDSFSFQVNTSSSGHGPRTLNFRLVEFTGGSNTTTIINEMGINQPTSGWAPGDWFTYSFTTPQDLDPNTTYGVDIQHVTGGDWGNGIPYFRENRPETVAGGTRYNRADGDPTAISQSTADDMVFHANIAANVAAIPEPSAALLFGIAGLTLVIRRRS
ncbi:MAG: choice-of-anchor R domain-containing protein [Akkermansiaceae bacterium]